MAGSLEKKNGQQLGSNSRLFYYEAIIPTISLASGLIRIQDSFLYHLYKVIERHFRMGYFPEGSVGIESHSRGGQFNCDCMRSLVI